jgi:hypothetical protein
MTQHTADDSKWIGCGRSSSADPSHPVSCVPPKLHVGAFDELPKMDEASMAAHLADGPLSVNINASSNLMRFYSYGVYDAECSPGTDHGTGHQQHTWLAVLCCWLAFGSGGSVCCLATRRVAGWLWLRGKRHTPLRLQALWPQRE